MAAEELRSLLLRCFEAALAAVDARACVQTALAAELLAGDWHVLAIGKAAGAMTLGAADQLAGRMPGALVVTKPGHTPPGLASVPRVHIIESSHPQPDESSLAAGEAVADFIGALPADANLLCLISGGASSLVERLAPGVTLPQLSALNAWALASGCAIGEVNALRRAVSTLKGGGLAALAGRRRCLALMISDVPRDDPAVLGSGLLHASSGRILVPASLPADLGRLLVRVQDRMQPPALPAVPYRIVASVRDACRAAATQGRAEGLQVHVARARFAGPAGRLGAHCARAVLAGPSRTLHVWGGESTMTLPPAPGYGGRNQHLALAAATVLAGHAETALLAAGTDGIDGLTADAGAVVDGGTLERGIDGGLDPRQSLLGADSGRFLEASGDLLHTGATLTNVGDVVLGVRGRGQFE